MKPSKTISAAELSRMSGLSVRWLRELGEALPKAKSGSGYLWPEAFRALVDHYRHAAKGARLDPLQNVKKLILEDRLALSRKQLVKTDELRIEVTTSIHAAKVRILALAEVCKVELGLTDAQAETVAVRVREALEELGKMKWNSHR